jgi:hypothetical protein
VRKAPEGPFFPTDVQEGRARFNTYFVFSSSMQEKFRRVDTSWTQEFIRHIPPYDTFTAIIPVAPASAGDMLLLNDSEYVTLQGSVHEGYPYSVIDARNFSVKISTGIYDWLAPIDTVRKVDNLYSGNPYMLLSPWKNNQFLMSGVGKHEFADPNQDSTAEDLAQAYVALFDRERRMLKCAFLSPDYNDEIFAGGTWIYNPALHRNLDFIDRNRIYFTATPYDDGLHSPYADLACRLQVISIDSNLDVRWRKVIGDPDSFEPAQASYSVIATHDGGCLLFCRIRKRFFNDPWFLEYQVPEWDLVVYKISEQGIVTGTHAISAHETPTPVAYPNPAGNRLYFNNAGNYHHLNLYDMKGRLMLESDLNEPFVNLDELATGLYLYTLSARDGSLFTGKVIKK